MISSPLQPFRNRNTMDLRNWLLDFPAESFPVLLCIFPYNILVKKSQTKIEHGYTKYFLTFSWVNEQIFCSSPAQMQGLYKRETGLRKKKKEWKSESSWFFSILRSILCRCSTQCHVLTREIEIERTILWGIISICFLREYCKCITFSCLFYLAFFVESRFR